MPVPGDFEHSPLAGGMLRGPMLGFFLNLRNGKPVKTQLVCKSFPHQAYEIGSGLGPEGNLVTICCDDLETSFPRAMRRGHEPLNLDDFDKVAQQNVQTAVRSQGSITIPFLWNRI